MTRVLRRNGWSVQWCSEAHHTDCSSSAWDSMWTMKVCQTADTGCAYYPLLQLSLSISISTSISLFVSLEYIRTFSLPLFFYLSHTHAHAHTHNGLSKENWNMCSSPQVYLPTVPSERITTPHTILHVHILAIRLEKLTLLWLDFMVSLFLWSSPIMTPPISSVSAIVRSESLIIWSWSIWLRKNTLNWWDTLINSQENISVFRDMILCSKTEDETEVKNLSELIRSGRSSNICKEITQVREIVQHQLRWLNTDMRKINDFDISKAFYLLFIDTNCSRCPILFAPNRVDLWAFSLALIYEVMKNMID